MKFSTAICTFLYPSVVSVIPPVTSCSRIVTIFLCWPIPRSYPSWRTTGVKENNGLSPRKHAHMSISPFKSIRCIARPSS